MRILFFLILIMHASVAPARSVGSTIKAWTKEQDPGLGLLKNVTLAAKALSVFEGAPSPPWDVAPLGMDALGLPLSLPGGLKAGYEFRQGITLAYGQAYLLHYQEGEPESDDHWFRLCKRQSDGSVVSLLELGTCVGELRQLKLSAKGPRFLLLVESACGSRVTMHLLHADGKEPMRGSMKLQGRQSDLRAIDLDGDGVEELIQRTWGEAPAALSLKVELASNFKSRRPVMLWLSTAWKWTGEGWERAGERWQQDEP